MSGKRTGSWWRWGGSKQAAAGKPQVSQRGKRRPLGFERLEDRALLTASALDSTFGNAGVVLTSVPTSSNNEILASVQQSNGQIVAVGEGTDNTSGLLDIALARYNSDGSLDSTFGTGEGTSPSPNGTVLLNVSGGDDVATSVALQSNGDIVVGGYAVVSGIQEFLVARFTPNGVLDSTFGNGNGYVETEIGSTAEVDGIGIESNGDIVVAGYGTGTSNQEFAVARYTSDGTLDTTFGSTGIVLTQVGTGDNHATGMVLQSNGDIVAGGWTDNSTSSTTAPEAALVRYTTSGTLDTTFASTGIVTLDLTGDDVIDSVALQSNGEIVFGGASEVSGAQHFVVGRYNTNGTLDTSFNGIGYEYTVMGAANAVNGITVDQQNRIVAFGTVYDGKNTEFAFARYNTNGGLDTSFNGSGIVTFSPGIATTSTQGSSVLIDGNDRIMAFGTSEDSSGSPDFAIVRLGPTFDLQNNTLVIHGTPGSDSLFVAFNSPTQFYAILNGVQQTYNIGTGSGQVNSVQYIGGQGSDGVVVVDSQNTDSVVLNPGALTLTNSNIQIATSGTLNQYFYGTSADTAQLNDASGSNILTLASTFTIFSGTGFNNQVFNVGNVTANSASGATDTAFLYSVSKAAVYLYPTSAMLTTSSATLTANSFSDVLAVSAGDGTDTAELFGANTGGDTFFSTPAASFMTGTTLSSATFWNTAMGFQNLSSFAEGGSNTAYLYDEAGTTNTFIGTASYSSMTGTGYSNVANGFTTVLGVGAAGSTDTAYLYDAAGQNSFYAAANSGVLTTPTNSVGVLNLGMNGGSVLVFNQNGSYDQQGSLNPSFSTQFVGTWN